MQLTCAQISNEKTLWSRRFKAERLYGPFPVESGVVIAGDLGWVARLRSDGEAAWKAAFEPILAFHGAEGRSVAFTRNAAHALASETGERIWQAPLPAHAVGQPAVATGMVVANLADGQALALDLQTGGTVFQTALPRSGAHEVVAADSGWILLPMSGRHGFLRRLDAAGTMVWRDQIDPGAQYFVQDGAILWLHSRERAFALGMLIPSDRGQLPPAEALERFRAAAANARSLAAAVFVLELAKAALPDAKPALWVDIVQLCLVGGQRAHAERALRQAVRECPDDPTLKTLYERLAPAEPIQGP